MKEEYVGLARDMRDLKFKGGLGIKDLRIFNMALLAKYGWKILQEKNTLPHKIYKAKYFSKVSTLLLV